MRPHTSLAEKKGLRLDDEVRFIRSWLEKPLAIGAVTPSGRVLARTMARYVDTGIPGPIVELGPGTGPVTEALVAHGVPQKRLVLVEFNPGFCRILRSRFLPLLNKPMRTRIRLINEAFGLMQENAPFVQFTYSMAAPPIPKGLSRVAAQASERIWMNLPPARVWCYRRALVS
jgi:phosphatidylethanolamine/phosphatidyl-N-methylethanolamine N-methyltransferase